MNRAYASTKPMEWFAETPEDFCPYNLPADQSFATVYQDCRFHDRIRVQETGVR